MRNRDLRPAAKANPTIQQAFERFQKYNRLKNLSQGSLDFYAAKGRSFFRFLGDTEQPIHTITEKTVEDYIFYMKDQKLQDTTINTNLRMVRAFLYWCMEKGYLEQFSIKLVRADDPIKEPYTTDELQKLLKEPDCKTCSFAEYRNWVIVFPPHESAQSADRTPLKGIGQDHGGLSGAPQRRPRSPVVRLRVWQPDDPEFAWQCGVEL